MSGTVALRHVERRTGETRPWTGLRLADGARLRAPNVRRVARELGDPSPGVAIVPTTSRAGTWSTVARLWLGVLSIFSLIVFLGLVIIILGAWAIGYRPVVVTSGSMEPTVRTGDIVITRPVDMDDKVGDQTVIDFDDPATADRRLHRVIEVTPEGYRTKGDANEDADAQLVPQDHVHGAGFMLAPFVGYLPVWVQEGRWAAVGAAGLVLIALATMSRRAWMWAGEAS